MTMEFWPVGLVANAVVGVAYVAVAATLAVNAIRTRQLRNNPLGVATVLVFATCGGGHFVHMMQLAGMGVVDATAYRFQDEYNLNWHMWVIDIITAVAAVTYWMLRRRFPALVSGAAVFEDLRDRQRRALEIHDNVVQGLVRAKLALNLKREEEGEEAVKATLDKARSIITGLLGREEIRPGALRRKAPASAKAGDVHGR